MSHFLVHVQWGLEFRSGDHLTLPEYFSIFWVGLFLSPFISRRVSRTFYHHLGQAEKEGHGGHPHRGADELKVRELE